VLLRRSVLFVVTALILCTAPMTRAGEGGVAPVHAQTEGSSGADQQAPATPPSTGTAAQTKGMVHDLWQKLKQGMTMDQVEQTLGPPEFTEQRESETVWFYHYENIGNGSLTFRQDGSLVSWQGPPHGWWPFW
jgi:hypothetical protein